MSFWSSAVSLGAPPIKAQPPYPGPPTALCKATMAIFSDPFEALASLQQALDSFRESSWLDAGPSGGGAYPPMNVFRKGDDFMIINRNPGRQKIRARGAGERPHAEAHGR